MKIRIPAKAAFACDLCLSRAEHKSNLDKCPICRRDYCRPCRAILPGCIVSPDICEDCGRVPVVEQVVEKFAGQLELILSQRLKVLISKRNAVKAFKRAQHNVG